MTLIVADNVKFRKEAVVFVYSLVVNITRLLTQALISADE